MLVRCAKCDKTVALSNESNIISVGLCPCQECAFNPTSYFLYRRNKRDYWEAAREKG